MSTTRRMIIASAGTAILGTIALLLAGFVFPSGGTELWPDAYGVMESVDILPHPLYPVMTTAACVLIPLAALLGIVAGVRTRRGL